jgi:hypothetical protein
VLTGGMRAWTRHRRAYHPNVDFSQYGNVMRTHISDSDALGPDVLMSSPPSSPPWTMEDYTVGGLPLDDFLLSDPPTYHSQPDTDDDLQSDGSFKIHHHSMLDGMPLFFIYVRPY